MSNILMHIDDFESQSLDNIECRDAALAFNNLLGNVPHIATIDFKLWCETSLPHHMLSWKSYLEAMFDNLDDWYIVGHVYSAYGDYQKDVLYHVEFADPSCFETKKFCLECGFVSLVCVSSTYTYV